MRRFRDALRKGTGAGVKIGVIDTGVADIPGLGNCIEEHFYIADIDKKLRLLTRLAGEDDLNHGTACADIIHRYAPEATLFDVKVMDHRAENSKYKLAGAIRLGIEQGWDVLNVCVGTQSDFSGLRQITAKAIECGLMIVAAVDCEGANQGFPASYPGVISVDYDMYHPLAFGFSVSSAICGHGVYVEAANSTGCSEYYTGSSFACPHITALAARALQFHPGIRAEDFLDRLRNLDASDVFPTTLLHSEKQ
ncbi:MAG: S8 family serine peptidase [Verrucomicrobiales bacterium]|nr:S8 family serine peptidase [Verrucomicrobiales bacterium]